MGSTVLEPLPHLGRPPRASDRGPVSTERPARGHMVTQLYTVGSSVDSSSVGFSSVREAARGG